MSHLSHWQQTVVDESGDVIPSATVEVRVEATGALAVLKSDRAGLTPKANPFMADGNGYADFYARGDAYKITVTGGLFSKTLRYVAIGTAQEVDVHDLTGFAGMRYVRSTGTGGDPSTGQLQGNSVNLQGATILYLSTIDASGNDHGNHILSFDDSNSVIRGTLTIRKAASGGSEVIYNITGSVTDLREATPASNVISVPVSYVSGTDATVTSDDVLVEFTRAGNHGDTGPAGSPGPPGADGSIGGIKWIFDGVTTDSDPGSGNFRLNNANPVLATSIFIDNFSSTGSDVSAWLDTLDDSGDASIRGILYITDVSSELNYFIYSVSGSVVDGTGYRKVTCAFIVKGIGSFVDTSPGAEYTFLFVARGQTGAQGIPGEASTTDRQNFALSSIYQSKSFVGYRRMLNFFADGYKASDGIAAGSSSNYTADTTNGRVEPAISSHSQISTGGLTKIGGMTGNGGLAAAFDGTTSQAQTACASRIPSASGYSDDNTVGVDWGVGITKKITQIILYGPSDVALLGGGGGSTIKLQGSPDNSAWTDLYTSGTILTAGGQSVTVNTGITTTTAYRYHRININGNGTNTCALAEVQFFDGGGVTQNMTVVTTAQPADASVSTSRALIEFDPIDAIALNTDLTIDLTCNGGTNWAAATLSSVTVNSQSGRDVAETGATSCTAGTSFQARIKNLNNKNVRIYGMTIQVS